MQGTFVIKMEELSFWFVSQPLFLYFAHQAPHIGNENALVQAPDSYVNRFEHITNETYRVFAGNR